MIIMSIQVCLRVIRLTGISASPQTVGNAASLQLQLLLTCTLQYTFTCACRAAGSVDDGFRITPDFVQSMVEWFRNQKNIHRRFAFQIVLEVGCSLPCPVFRNDSGWRRPGSYHCLMGVPASQLLQRGNLGHPSCAAYSSLLGSVATSLGVL